MEFQDDDTTVNGLVWILDFDGCHAGMIPYLERRQTKINADLLQVNEL